MLRHPSAGLLLSPSIELNIENGRAPNLPNKVVLPWYIASIEKRAMTTANDK